MTGSHALLPRALVSLKSAHPTLKVSVVESTDESLLEQLAHNQIDVLIGRMTPGGGRDITQIHLYDEPIRVVGRVGHPVFGLTDPQLEDLAAFPWVLPPPTAVGSRLGTSFGQVGVWAPANLIECTSILTIRSILRATDTLAPLPMLVGAEDEHLQVLSVELDAVPSKLGLTHSSSAELSDSALLFIDHLLKGAKEIEAELL